jgi:hypothetical protein
MQYSCQIKDLLVYRSFYNPHQKITLRQDMANAKNPVPSAEAYLGVRAQNPPETIISKGPNARDPNFNDKKYQIGTIWINQAANNIWELGSVVNNNANWVVLGSGLSSGLATFVTTGTTQQMLSGRAYISSNAALSTFTLPLTANVGDSIEIIGQGAGFWTIHQNAGQNIVFNAATTTTGTGGSITSTQAGNTIDLTCTVANTTWTVINTSGAQSAYTIV